MLCCPCGSGAAAWVAVLAQLLQQACTVITVRSSAQTEGHTSAAGGRTGLLHDATRRAQYQEQRCDILLKQKHDRAPCPLCNLTFRRVYIPRHMARRHPMQ